MLLSVHVTCSLEAIGKFAEGIVPERRDPRHPMLALLAVPPFLCDAAPISCY